MKNALRNLEMRIARLEKSAITKEEAYQALRRFVAQNKSNTRLLVELSGYLQILKDGGDLSERDLKSIRKQMHRNNASDLADMFRSNPTGRKPSPRVVSKKPKPKPKPVPKPKPAKDEIPKSLLSFARGFKKKVVGLFENSRSVTHTRKYDRIRKFRHTGDKEFYQTVLTFKGTDAAIILIEPVNDDYTFMPDSRNVFWKFKDYNTDYIQEELGNSGLLKTTIKDIVKFLLTEANTTAGGFSAYRGNVNFAPNNRDWEFMLEPGRRERQDHWHFRMNIDYEDEYYDWESDAWQDWSENYEYPLMESTEEELKNKFPILKANQGEWSVGVGEKGHVWINISKSLITG